MGPLIQSLLADLSIGSVGVWTLVVMAGAHGLREWRLTRKLSLDDRLARRDGYAKQVEMLLVENRQLRTEMHEMNQHHEAYRKICHDENDQLRRMLRTNADEIEGLKRQLSVQGQEIAQLKYPDQLS